MAIISKIQQGGCQPPVPARFRHPCICLPQPRLACPPRPPAHTARAMRTRSMKPNARGCMRLPALLNWLTNVVLITGRGHLTPLPLQSADERYHRRRFVLNAAEANAGCVTIRMAPLVSQTGLLRVLSHLPTLCRIDQINTYLHTLLSLYLFVRIA